MPLPFLLRKGEELVSRDPISGHRRRSAVVEVLCCFAVRGDSWSPASGVLDSHATPAAVRLAVAAIAPEPRRNVRREMPCRCRSSISSATLFTPGMLVR